MRSVILAIAATLGSFFLSFASPASAFEAFVTVPDAPGGASFSGCYSANGQLFGRYRFSFCFNRQGTYSVRGRAHCDGSLSWTTRRGEIDVNIRRTSCRNGVAWARADMTCRSNGRLAHNLLRQLGPSGNAITMRVSALRCTYFPTVRGYRSETFTARRN